MTTDFTDLKKDRNYEQLYISKINNLKRKKNSSKNTIYQIGTSSNRKYE